MQRQAYHRECLTTKPELSILLILVFLNHLNGDGTEKYVLSILWNHFKKMFTGKFLIIFIYRKAPLLRGAFPGLNRMVTLGVTFYLRFNYC